MKIFVDNLEVLRLSETQKKVIKTDIEDHLFDEDMKRRLKHSIIHKYERCFERLKAEWEPKLRANGVAMIPTDQEAFAELVFSQPGYKNRSQREKDEKNYPAPIPSN